MKFARGIAAIGALGVFTAALAIDSPVHAAQRSGGASSIQSPQSGEATDANQQMRIDTGFAISPVAVNLEGKNPRQVGLGSYLVNATGACNDCHTSPTYAPGGNPYMGQPEHINTTNLGARSRCPAQAGDNAKLQIEISGYPAREFELKLRACVATHGEIQILRHGVNQVCGAFEWTTLGL